MNKRQTLRILTGIGAGITAILATLSTPAVGAIVPAEWAFAVLAFVSCGAPVDALFTRAATL